MAASSSQSADFEGASGASASIVRVHECKVCKETFVLYHFLAFVNKKTKEFDFNGDPRITKAKQEAYGQTFENQFVKEREVMLACYKCCEQLHKAVYSRVNENGEVRVNSKW